MEMIKNEKIERAFKRYFDGVPKPQVDLTAAKTELRASVLRRQRVRRGLKWQIPAFAAVLLLAVILGMNFLPSLFIIHYSVADADAQTLTYSELRENYGGYLDALNRFALADNTSADYTLYSINGRGVLLGADVKLLSGFYKLHATVWVDLSDGKYVADEFSDYSKLKGKRGQYHYEVEYVNGEYVCRAYAEQNETRYFVDLTTQDDRVFYDFMESLLP